MRGSDAKPRAAAGGTGAAGRPLLLSDDDDDDLFDDGGGAAAPAPPPAAAQTPGKTPLKTQTVAEADAVEAEAEAEAAAWAAGEAVDAAIDLEDGESPSQVDTLSELRGELLLLEQELWARQVSANWPAYRLTWRHRVSEAATVEQLRTFLAHLEQECPSAAALGADWAHGRARWRQRVQASGADDLPLLLLQFARSAREVPGERSAAALPPADARRRARARPRQPCRPRHAVAGRRAGGALAAVARAPRPQARLLFRRSWREV